MNGNERTERRHQSDFKTHRDDLKKWSETWVALVVAIATTVGLLTGAYAVYQSKWQDPHINKLIDEKQRPIYDKLKEMKDQSVQSAETQDRIFYMLSQHLNPGEKARASQDYNFYKGKKEP